MSAGNKDENQFKGVDGTIFGLFPESSRSLYQECVASLAARNKDPKIKVASTLDWKESSVVATTQKIQEAEVVIADVTGHDLSVMCELGIACGLKEAKKIILLRSRVDFEQPRRELPLDLEAFTIQEYDPEDFVQLRIELVTTLNDSLRNPAPVEPIENKFVRQTVERAVKMTQAKDWDIAAMLFEKANGELENHWYIHMQWGVMHRENSDYREAIKHLQIAETQAHFPEQQAQVLIERAILAFYEKQASEVERLLTKAKNTHKKNRQLYIVWADIYDRLGLPAKALRQVLELMQEVGQDSEAELLTRYYTAKINDHLFSMSLAEFEEFEKSEAAIKVDKSVRPEGGQQEQKVANGQQNQSKVYRVPRGVSWPEFRHRFQGKTVHGTVRNWHGKHGAFIFVGQFKGLLPRKWATSKKQYAEGREVQVRINRAYKGPDGVLRIDLREAK